MLSLVMSDDRTIASLVGQTYDAALGDEDWTVVLGRVSTLLGGEAAALHPTGSPKPTDVALRVGCDPSYIPVYNAHYHQTWPIIPMLPRLQAGSVFIDRMLVPEPAFLRTEFYNDYVKPQGGHSGLYWVDFDQHGLSAHLSLWRSRRKPDWDDEQVRLLRHLGSHIGRALKIQRRLMVIAAHGPDAPAPLLAPRERDCLACVARGASSKQAAQRLALSVHTVNDYVASAMRKLQATNRTEAVAMALTLGLLDA
ncbi:MULTISPECIES: response regulator transcription factor [Inquilinus]|uniref:DNA-binding CsgD family transcriptional regulator n=1 Tax=Inquilinus ginsengisoli TaxID=363840 RepID=A0ABU1JJD2_9PROT|nr:helix-turn-helix transcriptional regulator [Inquilinus ginsengisoli]MDR6287670.1 DNA-binding CsgD family transcriptional regulator [Inquilinus ginsengisoli]